MNWRDRFTAVGSFRGAEFVMRSGDQTLGRRVQIHEFPGRDDPQAEDLGLRKKEHSIEVFVSGADYQSKRDALIKAINTSGPGTLVHPFLGRLNVTITTASKKESTREGGMATFNISFVITPAVPVFSSVDTQVAVANSVTSSLTNAINDFSNVFDTLNQANDFVQGVVDDVDTVMTAAENVVSGVTNTITQLVTAPFDMGTAIVGAFNSIKSSLGDPLAALNVYRQMYTAGDNQPATPTTTPSRQQEADNIAAVHRIIQQSAVASACLMSSQMTFASLDDAINMRDELMDQIDNQVSQTMSSDLYQSFIDMRSAMVIDLRERSMLLPRIESYIPQTTLPALVIAHQLYGDATREDEIVTRNNIFNPGFVPGGVALEVLADV